MEKRELEEKKENKINFNFTKPEITYIKSNANFTIEEDLSPRFFAPGKGNTPDMELYKDDYVIVPEVSLMTGVLQWEHEASSVIDHILNIMKNNLIIF